MLGLEGQQPPHELVVLGVGDLGFVELVVPRVVVADLVRQLLHPRPIRILGQVHGRSHGSGHVVDVSQGVAQGCGPPHAAAIQWWRRRLQPRWNGTLGRPTTCLDVAQGDPNAPYCRSQTPGRPAPVPQDGIAGATR